MKRPFIITMIFIILAALFLAALARQNDIASFGKDFFSFTSFTRAGTGDASTILKFWNDKEAPERKLAVENIIRLDYYFMVIYLIGFTWLVFFLATGKGENRKWIKTILWAGLVLIITATIMDALQDNRISHFLQGTAPVNSMSTYTKIKWWCFKLGVLPIMISLLPRDFFSLAFVHRLMRFVSQLLKAVWLFFPAILFLIFPVFCFWLLGQGKDIIVAFIDNRPSSNHVLTFNYFRLIFFLAISFWVYASWFSSRILAYIKKKQQFDQRVQDGMDLQQVENDYDAYSREFETGRIFLDGIPRLIGNSCFLILELAVLQLPVLYKSMPLGEAWMFFVIALIIIWQVNSWISQKQNPGKQLNDAGYIESRKTFKRTFHSLSTIFLVLLFVTSFFDFGHTSIWVLFILLILLHIIFILYTNLRRVEVENYAPIAKADAERETNLTKTYLKKIMDFFCIPRKETGYFRWFIIICVAAIVFYLMAIFWLGFARGLGPFSLVILAFGVLLIFGNTVAAFSVKYRVNFHFLLFVLALIFGLRETHNVRTVALTQPNGYATKPGLKTYLSAWLSNKNLSSDTCFDAYFIMSNGGASRSGYWTAAVLGKIEDSTIVKNPADRFSDHVFCLSGTSGGGVGVATFFSLLQNRQSKQNPWFTASAKSFLQQDYFTYTFARMLGPDFFNYIFHFSTSQDRGAALESSFESSAADHPDSTYKVPFDTTLSSFRAYANNTALLPLLFVNTTRMQDGNPGVVTNINLDSSQNIFNRRIDVVKLLDSNRDISLASGAILGARFPYLSPAGRIKNDYYVDGGYFDNSGAGVVQEIIRGILEIAKQDTTGILTAKIKHLNFKILHIVNSPVGYETTTMTSVAPIKNDLASPLLTIIGAYNEQTTVNDVRLRNYLGDINKFEANRAWYTQISLYELPPEWNNDPLRKRFRSEPPYAMNWFMSDTTIHRIDQRLQANPALQMIIDNFSNKTPLKR